MIITYFIILYDIVRKKKCSFFLLFSQVEYSQTNLIKVYEQLYLPLGHLEQHYHGFHKHKKGIHPIL
jgi:hypothetical protein